MKKILFLGFISILMAGCSPEKMFEMLAKSDIEQAASESVQGSSQVIARFDAMVAEKKPNFAYTAKLEGKREDAGFGHIFIQDNAVEAYAIVPPLEKNEQYYQVWLIEKSTLKSESVGRMILDESTGTRGITFTPKKEISQYSSLVVTIEDGTTNEAGDVALEASISID